MNAVVLLIGTDRQSAIRIADLLRKAATVIVTYDHEDSLRVLRERKLGEIDLIVFADKMESDREVLGIAHAVSKDHYTAVCFADTGSHSLDRTLVEDGHCVGYIPLNESTAGFIANHPVITIKSATT